MHAIFVGLGVELISRGRYAEVLASSRRFNSDEEQYFADGAKAGYLSFITKAAASRNMSIESMNEVAQGRVWTGKQALHRSLIDSTGGLWNSLLIATQLCNYNFSKSINSVNKEKNTMELTPSVIPIEFIKELPQGLASLFSGSAQSNTNNVFEVQAICDDIIYSTTFGPTQSDISPMVTNNILQIIQNINPLLGKIMNKFVKFYQIIKSIL